MNLELDIEKRTVVFDLPSSTYAQQSFEIAAHIFDKRADVELAADDDEFEVTLTAKRKGIDEKFLQDLAGEFGNELLNQEYRALVGDFNKKITGLILTQTLYSARGGGKDAPEPADESTAEFKADVKKMMDEARTEIARTMPKKIKSQGIPLTLPKEDSVG